MRLSDIFYCDLIFMIYKHNEYILPYSTINVSEIIMGSLKLIFDKKHFIKQYLLEGLLFVEGNVYLSPSGLRSKVISKAY